ncbi:transglycosylase SLT domain-containing protein [bacterium]|nr:transglycosylase SLT domain-containing protein [bacterium]
MIRKLAMFTVLVILLAMRVEASEIPVNHVKDTIVKHSVEMGVDPALALSLAKAESGYSHATKSPYGAVGVFQLMPSTAKKMGVNPYHLDGNIKGGLMYYKMLYKMFGSTELALAAYHTGPAYVIKHKQPAPCSKRYVAAIMSEYYKLKAHTDPSVIRHNAKIKAQKQAEAKAKAKAAAEAKAKAQQQAQQQAQHDDRIEHSAMTVAPDKSV